MSHGLTLIHCVISLASPEYCQDWSLGFLKTMLDQHATPELVRH